MEYSFCYTPIRLHIDNRAILMANLHSFHFVAVEQLENLFLLVRDIGLQSNNESGLQVIMLIAILNAKGTDVCAHETLQKHH